MAMATLIVSGCCSLCRRPASSPSRKVLCKSSFASISPNPSTTLTFTPSIPAQQNAGQTLDTAHSYRRWSSGIAEIVGQASMVALVTTALCFVDPALAFKGGGPYGAEVTRGAELSGKDFSGRNLVKQDFKTAILRQANFKGANLQGASFFDADLTGADLSDADLRGADFSLANVTKANLSNANLEGALVTGNTSFKGSNITGADFTDVPLRDDQRRYLCTIAEGVNITTGNATRDTLLC